MTKSLKVYGLPQNAMENLRTLSEKKYGSANVSNFARDLLLKVAEDTVGDTDIPKYSSKQAKTRMELKLPPKVAAWLNQTAEAQHMTPNAVALSILLEYIDKTPVLLGQEAQELHSSNYQLLRIGRNLNQMVKKMNFGEPVSLTLQHIVELKNLIDAHTEKVGRVLRANRKRGR
ncbi:hypothetical protein [Neisseria sp.]|uniref:hypothetical protein n=1 Tax=Neisseria sp. TaxID=192066 RepID=UPI0035A03748